MLCKGKNKKCTIDSHLDNCLSNPQCIFLFIVLAMMMLKILIQSASILPFLHPFVQINPANKFLHLASNLQSQFNWSKQLSIKSGEEEVVGPAAAGWAGALILMGRWMEESKLCVYQRCGRAFLGRQGSGKAPLEDQRHSQQRPEGNRIQRSGRKTRPEQSKKTTRSSSK